MKGGFLCCFFVYKWLAYRFCLLQWAFGEHSLLLLCSKGYTLWYTLVLSFKNIFVGKRPYNLEPNNHMTLSQAVLWPWAKQSYDLEPSNNMTLSQAIIWPWAKQYYDFAPSNTMTLSLAILWPWAKRYDLSSSLFPQCNVHYHPCCTIYSGSCYVAGVF